MRLIGKPLSIDAERNFQISEMRTGCHGNASAT
jgi:hypothetical protein